VTTISFGMRLVSRSYSECSISMSTTSIISLSYRESSCFCGCSPCSSFAAHLESSTYIDMICIVFAACTSSCSYTCSSPRCTSLSILCNSCSSLSFCSTSYNFLSTSSSIFFSLFLCSTLLSHFHLFPSTSKATLSTSGSSLNLQLCFVFVLSTKFLLPLSYADLFLATTIVSSPYGVTTLNSGSLSTAMLTGSLSLEEL